MASKSAGLIAGLVVIEPGGALLESVIRFTSSQGVDTSVVVGLGGQRRQHQDNESRVYTCWH
jgi:hypothetical protein